MVPPLPAVHQRTAVFRLEHAFRPAPGSGRKFLAKPIGTEVSFLPALCHKVSENTNQPMNSSITKTRTQAATATLKRLAPNQASATAAASPAKPEI